MNQLAQRVEFFGQQLAGADDAQRGGAVLQLRGPKLFHHSGERFFPINTNQLAAFAQQRIFGAIGGRHHVVFGKAFGAKLT